MKYVWGRLSYTLTRCILGSNYEIVGIPTLPYIFPKYPSIQFKSPRSIDISIYGRTTFWCHFKMCSYIFRHSYLLISIIVFVHCEKRSEIQLIDNGYENIVIAIRSDVTENYALIKAIQVMYYNYICLFICWLVGV